jgi:hypothetical protein
MPRGEGRWALLGVLCLGLGCVRSDEQDAKMAYREIARCERLMTLARTPADSVFIGNLMLNGSWTDCREWLSLTEVSRVPE